MKSGDLLFVYGSLRKGERADLSRNPAAEYVGEDRINGELYAVSWYPGLKARKVAEFEASSPVVFGDVFRVNDDRACRGLDAYEGYPDLFNRVETVTALGQKVWVYVYNHAVAPDQLVGSGDWRLRVESKVPLSI